LPEFKAVPAPKTSMGSLAKKS